MDIAELRKRKRLATRTCEVLLEPDLATRLQQLRKDLARQEALDAKTNDRDLAPAIRREIDDVEQAIVDATVTFTFQALPRRDFVDLVESAPPKPSDVDDGLDFDPETLFAPLVAASCVDPAMDVSDAEAIFAEWEDAEVTKLFATAYQVSKEARNVPFVRRSSDGEDGST